jgi:TonB dependent receptor-like, beta-barrel/Carboxypeptidase regulatory-like domain
MTALLVLLLAASLNAASIQGVVRTEGSREPIALASIALPELQRRVLTDAKGFFVLAAVPAGRWRVDVSALGYSSHTVTVVVGDAGTVRLDFDLRVTPVALPSVTVQTQSSGSAAAASATAGSPPVRVDGPQLKNVPGLAEPDVLRALQILPSVSAISDYSTALYVRGGSTDQNAILLDGVPLFNPYHVGGLFSAIGGDAVSWVDVWPGGLPASAPDRLSSVVAINTRQGGKDRVRTSGGIGLLSTTATIDGPFNAGRGSFLFAGRRTYADAITNAAHRIRLIKFEMPYNFTDAYSKLTHSVGSLGALTASAYWDGELLHFRPSNNGEPKDFGRLAWGSHMLSLNYRQPLGGTVLLDARLGYTDFRGGFDGWSVSTDQEQMCDANNRCEWKIVSADSTHVIDAFTDARDLLGSADLSWFFNHHTLRAGVQLDLYHFVHDVTDSDIDTVHLPRFRHDRRARTIATYLEDQWAPSERLSIRAGLRMLDGGDLGRTILPRLGARYQLSPKISLSTAFSRNAQAVRTMKDDESVISSLIAYDVLTVQPERAGLARASDVVVGAQYEGSSTMLRIDAFWKSMSHLALAPQSIDPLDAPPLVIDSFRLGTGSVHGVEVSARQQIGSWNIGLGYALNFAERRAGDDVFTPRFERRHQFDVTAEYRRGERTLLSAHLAAASGQAYTPIVGMTQRLEYDAIHGEWLPGDNWLIAGEHNTARLPGYFRLDVAARRSYEKRWFGRAGVLTPYLQIVNVLNTKNALVAEPQPNLGRPLINYWPQLPLIPTFGLEWRF